MPGELDITASIMQRSAIGPASYVINAADLATVTAGNLMFNYADDTYIVIPAANVNSRYAELDQVDRWALNNNLRHEIIFTDRKRKFHEHLPLQIPDIRRITSVKILSHHDESSVRRRARPRRHRRVRAVPPCPETAALPWHEGRLAEARLQGRRPLQATVRLTGMVGLYQRGRQATSRSNCTTCSPGRPVYS